MKNRLSSWGIGMNPSLGLKFGWKDTGGTVKGEEKLESFV